MDTSIDLYSEEYVNDYVDLDEENENQEEQSENVNAEPLGNENQGEIENENKEAEKKIVKPKRVIKNPRPKLNVEALKSRKGLVCLEEYFKNKKFKGRGHEEEDLRTILKTYEYWCHRLFPKCPFDECLEKLEKLGTKKNVQTFIKRIRLNLIFDEEQPIRSDHEDEQAVEPNSDGFENLLSPQDNANQVPTLTEEQLERIRLNREKANQLRQEKLQRAKEKAQASLSQEISSELIEMDALKAIESTNLQNVDVTQVEEVEQEENTFVDLVRTVSDNETRGSTLSETTESTVMSPPLTTYREMEVASTEMEVAFTETEDIENTEI